MTESANDGDQVTSDKLVATTESLSLHAHATTSTTTTTATSTSKNVNTWDSLDFVSTKKSVLNLFSLPYSDKSISVGIHNIEGCLIIDADPALSKISEEGGLFQDQISQPKPHDNPQLQQSAALSAINSLIEDGRRKINNAEGERSETTAVEDSQMLLLNQNSQAIKLICEKSSSEPREYLPWKFEGFKLLLGSDAVVYRSGPDKALTVRIEDAAEMRTQLKKWQMKRDSNDMVNQTDGKAKLSPPQSTDSTETAKRSYAEALKSREMVVTSDNEQKNGLPDKSDLDVTARNDPSYDSIYSSSTDEVTHAANLPVSLPLGGGQIAVSLQPPAYPSIDKPTSPLYTVIDAYLDQLITQVPQLALVLREKGFVRSVKLLQTEHIPKAFLQEATFDTSHPFEIYSSGTDRNGDKEEEEIFDPNIMQMNGASLLNFLRTNCNKDNATYLLHREAGQTNIQLFDVSAISGNRQRKWIWWLAMMSYRFSHRLRHLSLQGGSNSPIDKGTQRSFRARERSLLQNTLSLLEDFADLGGATHELLLAEVCEKLAHTFLRHEDLGTEAAPAPTPNHAPCPVTSTTTLHQRYSNAKPDALTKAQDHLTKGIGVLKKVWKQLVDQLEVRKQRQSNLLDDSGKAVSVSSDSSGSDEEDDDHTGVDPTEIEALRVQAETISMQLFSLYGTSIDIQMVLATHHLNAYWSSSAMQALRTAARTMADAVRVCQQLESITKKANNRNMICRWKHGLRLQFTSLWELCGHFARSFAADDLWRERGHAAGDDVVAVLRDVEAALSGESSRGNMQVFFVPASDEPEQVTLYELSGIVDCNNEATKESIEAAKKLLDNQRQLQRDRRRVLVAAGLAYGRASSCYERSFQFNARKDVEGIGFDGTKMLNLLRQRQGDASNELAKLLLNELRTLLSQNSGDRSSPLDAPHFAVLSSAKFWFTEGLKAFELCQDLQNSALLRCNLCQAFKLQANSIFSSTTPDRASHADACLKQAIHHLQAAHESIGERDLDPITWDMVSGELAATLLVSGVRRRQAILGGGSAPLFLQSMRLSPGETRSMIEPMERALKIYEQIGNNQQAANTHYQYALLLSRLWTCQRDEAMTRDKLSAAFEHYGKAHAYFIGAIRGNEQTFVLLCLDICNLYSTVSGEECLRQSLLRCLDTVAAFSKESIEFGCSNQANSDEWRRTMTTLASSVEDRVFKTLRCLVKMEENAASTHQQESDKKQLTMFRDLYRLALSAKMSAVTHGDGEDGEEKLLAIHKTLIALREGYSSLSS